jgi:hypothetical protein
MTQFTMSRTRKIATAVGVTALLGGGIALATGTSNAAESCQGLDTALRNNLNFIAGQQATPDAQSAARIANRQAVIDLIEQRRAAAGCDDAAPAEDEADAPQAPDAPAAEAPAAEAPPAEENNNAGGAGEVVCQGSTVTLSGEGGAPAASSSQFPPGTQLRVTNLDNNKSTTVEVTSGSGSCVLLNNAAFEQVREPGKFLIRRAVIERVG